MSKNDFLTIKKIIVNQEGEDATEWKFMTQFYLKNMENYKAKKFNDKMYKIVIDGFAQQKLKRQNERIFEEESDGPELL